MRQRERTETARSAKGALAALRARLGARGRGAPSSRRPVALAAASLLAALCALAALAAPAAAPAAEPEAEPCPNERLREESNLDPATERPYSTELPDCRAFEMVSPAFHNLNLTEAEFFSPDGSRMFSYSIGVYAGGYSNPSAGLGIAYVFSRTASGWQAASLSAPNTQFTGTNSSRYSASATGEILQFLRPATAPNSELDLYRRSVDGTVTEVGPLLPPGPALPVEPGYRSEPLPELFDASPDLSHAVWMNPSRGLGLWPGATSGEHSVYEYAGTGNSEPELVAVRNVGTVAAAAAAAHDAHLNEAAQPIAECGAYFGMGHGSLTNTSFGIRHNAISADGETVYVTVNPCGPANPVSELYARLHRERTVAISEPPLQGECHEAACVKDATEKANFRDAAFQGASEDGHLAFFLSPQRLLDSAAQDPNPESPLTSAFYGCVKVTGPNGCNLYAYDLEKPEGEALIDLSAGDTSGKGPQVQGVGTVSADGSHVYFVAKGVLTGAQTNEHGAHTEAGQDNLYAYDLAAERVTFVAVLSPEDQIEWKPNEYLEVEGDGERGHMQTTPNGRYLLFSSHADLTPDAEGSVRQLYRYDSATNQLVRVSIGEGGFNHDGNVDSFLSVPPPVETHLDYSPGIADDGTVVFARNAALTPSAVEGVDNVYEYEGGHVRLLISGSKVIPDGIDPSGRDIFIGTRDSLVPADTNSSLDVYDARVEGGFPAPVQSHACQGEVACRPAEAAPAEPAGPISPGFNGREEGPNHPQGPPRKRHRHHHHRKHRRAATHNPGGVK